MKVGRKTVARARPITRKQVKSYDYVAPNPGVRTLVAVNGKGAFGRRPRTARAAMAGLTPAQRIRHARQFTAAERATVRLGENSMKRTARKRIRRALSGARKSPSPAQLKARARFAAMARARAGRGMRKNRATPKSYAQGWDAIFGKKAKKRTSRKRRVSALKTTRGRKALRSVLASGAKSARATAKRYKRYKHGHKLSKAERAAISRRNLAKARAARKGRKLTANRSRRRVVRRRRTAAQRRASLANLRRARKIRLSPNRRRRVRRSRRRTLRANPRRTKRTKRARAAAKRRTRRTAARRTTRRVSRRRPARRTRRTARRARLSPNRRRRTSRRRASSSRRRMRRNGRKGVRLFGKRFRRNSTVGIILQGASVAGGFMAHKALVALAEAFVITPLFAETAVTPAATAGMLPAGARPIVSNVVSILAALGGIYLTKQLIKDKPTADLVIGGMVASAVHKAAVSVLSLISPPIAGYLSGSDDGTAARISAMYGFGGSIMPQYAPISGYGEYFNGTGEYFNGVGEYLQPGMSGMGDYFESGVEGFGNYGPNPDMAEAAAGYGSVGFGESNNSNNIDPSSDLDYQLTIAEAAAGIGASPYEASAGYGQLYEASAGFGSIQQTPATSTWIPGSSNPQLWAGTRAANRGQSATAMVPAGILETHGGGGIFG